MTLESLRDAWNSFFFAEQSPAPIASFRIVYGVLVIANLLLLRPDWLAWYGNHAWVSLQTMQSIETGRRLNLFTVIPQTDGWINALFWMFLASAILLTIGFLTRVNSLIVFLCLASIQQRNLFILHGGDTFMRVAGFFLIFAPAGAAFSIDQRFGWFRWSRIWRGKEGPLPRLYSPWAQRMIQIQLALVYFSAFCWKMKGQPWIHGTALFYVYHLNDLRRFPVPAWFVHPTVLKLGTWFALVFEFSMGVLIWVKKLRYPLLVVGVVFHLWLEYSLNIQLFQWEILSAYILFVDPADLAWAWNWIKGNKYHGTERNGGIPGLIDMNS